MNVNGVDVIDLIDRARNNKPGKPGWGLQTEDLNLNLVVLHTGGSVAHHTNTEVDVLLLGIDGEGSVEIEGRTFRIGPGKAVVVPKGSTRSVCCVNDHFAYLSCHRRRAGLWPEGIPRSSW